MFGAKLFSVHFHVTQTLPLSNNNCFRNGRPTCCFNVEPPTARSNAPMLCLCSNNKVNDDAVFSVTPSNNCDVDYLGESTKGNLHVKVEHLEAFGIDGHAALEGPIEEVARTEAREAEDLLKKLDIPSPSSRNSPRGIFCTRTLNLRSISAIGYDMDYTLMHYNVKFVDDIVITRNDQEGIQALKQHLFQHGHLHYFLGIEVTQSKSSVALSQGKYVLNLLEEIRRLDCKSIDIPMDDYTCF